MHIHDNVDWGTFDEKIAIGFFTTFPVENIAPFLPHGKDNALLYWEADPSIGAIRGFLTESQIPAVRAVFKEEAESNVLKKLADSMPWYTTHIIILRTEGPVPYSAEDLEYCKKHQLECEEIVIMADEAGSQWNDGNRKMRILDRTGYNGEALANHPELPSAVELKIQEAIAMGFTYFGLMEKSPLIPFFDSLDDQLGAETEGRVTILSAGYLSNFLHQVLTPEYQAHLEQLTGGKPPKPFTGYFIIKKNGIDLVDVHDAGEA